MSQLTFKDLGLSAKITQALDDLSYEVPTEIQAKAIPLLRDSQKDFIGQAQTGTGKTAAFLIPILEKIDLKSRDVQTLILAPTRELANQVEKEIAKLGKYVDVRSTCVYGGMSYEKQINALKVHKPQIVVGTPGRVIDLINKRFLKLGKATHCILDEADEMLNMGFYEDVQTILESFNDDRQLIMFSATMPRGILDLIKKAFKEYEIVKIEKKSLSNDDIEQKHFIVKDKYFKEAISRLIDNATDVYGIIFCRTKIETKVVGDELKSRGYNVEVLNGDMGQNERDYAMRNFKEKKVTLLVCTDVAARGIDVDSLTHVFNYGLPQDNESYVHRIGRTGRAGMKGKAYTIVSPGQAYGIRRLEKHVNKRIDLAKLPSISELKETMVQKELASAEQLLVAIKGKGDEFKTDKSYELFYEQFSELDKEEILKAMFSWKFNKALRHYDFLPDIEAIGKSSRGGSGSYGRGRGGPRRSGGGARGGRTFKRSAGGSGRDARRDDRRSSTDKSAGRSARPDANRRPKKRFKRPEQSL